MKANELQKQIRIGNHLLGKCIDDLDDRKEWWEIYKIQDAEHLMGIKDGWDKPIELTEEILLKCGFYYDTDYLTFCIPTCTIQLDDYGSEGYMCIIFGEDLYLINNLHQLQNLYFALTGQELEINL